MEIFLRFQLTPHRRRPLQVFPFFFQLQTWSTVRISLFYIDTLVSGSGRQLPTPTGRLLLSNRVICHATLTCCDQWNRIAERKKERERERDCVSVHGSFVELLINFPLLPSSQQRIHTTTRSYYYDRTVNQKGRVTVTNWVACRPESRLTSSITTTTVNKHWSDGIILFLFWGVWGVSIVTLKWTDRSWLERR